MMLLGFRWNPSKQLVYIRLNDDVWLVIGVYVDDLVITGSSRKDIKAFKGEMLGKFRMSDLGLLLHYYIDIEVEQGPIGSLGRCLVKGHMQQRYHLVQESIDSDLINAKFTKERI
jgi:hypothetical protein